MPPTRDRKVNRAFQAFEEAQAITDWTAGMAKRVTKVNVLLVCPVCPVSKEMLGLLVCPVWTDYVVLKVTTDTLALLAARATKAIAAFRAHPDRPVLTAYPDCKEILAFLVALALKV